MNRSSCRDEDIKEKIPLPFIRKYPFIDEIVRDLIVCSQYKYLTIITDGAINPTPNQTKTGRPRNNLIISFDNGDRWKIEHSLFNLNIERYGALYFTNANYDTMVTCHPCNGYGNITLILSVDQFPRFDNTHMQPPWFCKCGAIDSQETISWWAGKYNIFAPATSLLIPYIPLGYNQLRVQMWCNDTWQYSIKQYCCNDVANCETDDQGVADTTQCINIPLYSDRIYFEIMNRGNAGLYCFQATWIRKGKF